MTLIGDKIRTFSWLGCVNRLEGFNYQTSSGRLRKRIWPNNPSTKILKFVCLLVVVIPCSLLSDSLGELGFGDAVTLVKFDVTDQSS
jgi:hypothetical protein